MENSNYGFIITRHVNSEQTNRYWNQNVKLIRTFYPLKKIVIIDDNSDKKFVKADFPYNNLIVIQSEFQGRGEVLPYYYYLKYKWFPNAIIMHDSLFVHRRIPFESIKMPVLPLWHHEYDKENLPNILRIALSLYNNGNILRKLNGNEINILGLNMNGNKFNLCFGAQCYIKLSFLEHLQNKYKITNLVHVIKNRTDRCAFERVIGVLFCEEYPKLLKVKSLFGDIIKQYRAFNYNYTQYKEDLKRRKVINPFVKVWTGR
jgi:hypothetical protein